MRGGKREGAGRKGFTQSKTIRIPIELEPKIIELITQYKASFEIVTKSKTDTIDFVTKSKGPVNTETPILNDDQKRRFQSWLTKHGYARNISETLRITKTPELCRYTFLKFRPMSDEHEMINIQDIVDLYDASEI